MSILSKLALRFGRSPTPVAEDAESVVLSSLLRHSCPGCSGALESHHYTLLGVTIVSPDTADRVRCFAEAFRAGRWEEIAGFGEFDGSFDALEAFAVDCPQGLCSVHLVRDPFELFFSSDLLDSKLVSPAAWQAIMLAAHAKQWRAFAPVST